MYMMHRREPGISTAWAASADFSHASKDMRIGKEMNTMGTWRRTWRKLIGSPVSLSPPYFYCKEMLMGKTFVPYVMEEVYTGTAHSAHSSYPIS